MPRPVDNDVADERKEAARDCVRQIIASLLRPVAPSQETPKYPALTFVELLCAGAYFTKAMVVFGIDAIRGEMYEILATVPPDRKSVV